MTSAGDPIEATLDAARALVRAGVEYAIGGSLASTVHGEPRATQDVDVVAVLDSDKAGRLAVISSRTSSSIARRCARRR